MKIAVWGLGDRYREIKNIILMEKESWLLIDKNPEKGLNPEMLSGEMVDFFVIGTTRFEDEIRDELKRYNISDNKIIPWNYFVMQERHHEKYSYLNEWKKNIENNSKVKVLGNWYEYNGKMEMIFSVADNLGKEVDILFFTVKETVSAILIDVKQGNKIIAEYWNNDAGVCKCCVTSNDMLLKLEINGLEIPHVDIRVCKTEWNYVVQRIHDDEVRKLFWNSTKQLYTYFGYHEEDYLFFRNIRSVKNVLILDCGANYGQSIYSFLKATDYMKIISFEANPLLAEPLKIVEQFNSDRVRVFNFGLASEQREIKFFFSDKAKGISGSFLKEDLVGRLQSCHLGEAEIKEMLVPVYPADDLVDGDNNVNFIKIDIEGYEYEAIMGMSGIIKRCRPVLLIEKNVASMPLICKYLEENYDCWYYNYHHDQFTKENEDSSINYWLIPKNGTINKEIDEIIQKRLKKN